MKATTFFSLKTYSLFFIKSDLSHSLLITDYINTGNGAITDSGRNYLSFLCLLFNVLYNLFVITYGPRHKRHAD